MALLDVVIVPDVEDEGPPAELPPGQDDPVPAFGVGPGVDLPEIQRV